MVALNLRLEVAFALSAFAYSSLLFVMSSRVETSLDVALFCNQRFLDCAVLRSE